MELAFGDFRLDMSRKMLWHRQSFVPIGERAYAILSILVSNPGKLVSKAELFERAWPGVTVDSTNLRVQVANLRKALGELGAELITEQSLGYRFNVTVRAINGATTAPAKRFNAPVTLLRPLGRDGSAETIINALKLHRLVSIVGPGGIGKTTLALHVASLVESDYPDGVCFVDLNLVDDPRMVAIATAAALERPVMVEPSTDVRTYLKTRRLLLVLDCCERVIDACIDLSEAILGDAPGINILITSREPMRVSGEFVERLDGLELPQEDEISPESATRYGAIALFGRTAKAANSAFTFDEMSTPVITSICRRLDGIPLAIDLAAGLTATLDLQQIQRGLTERLSVLAFGQRRGGLPRHRTLDAAIAWSYDMLGGREAIAFQRLSIFADSFSMNEAVDTIAFEPLDIASVTLSVVSLAQKSLLNVEMVGDSLAYRLLETTRQFASSQSSDHTNFPTTAANHANHVLRRMRSLVWEDIDVAHHRPAALGLLKEVRQALGWFTAHDEARSAIELILAAERLFVELGLYAEHGEKMQAARQLALQARLGDRKMIASILTGISYGALYEIMDAQRIETIREAIEMSQAVNEPDLYMRNLNYYYYFHIIRHRGKEALAAANDLLVEARKAGSRPLTVYATIIIAIAQVQLGRWTDSRAILEEFERSPYEEPPRSVAIFFGFNIDAVAYFVLATIECYQGKLNRAFELIERALSLTEENEHHRTRFQVLYFGACYLSFLSSDWDRARRYLDMTERHARDYAPWQLMTSALDAWMAFDQGRIEEARATFEPFWALDVPAASMTACFGLLLSASLRMLGDFDGADRSAEDVLARATAEEDPFMIGPALKAKADIIVGRGDASKIEEAVALYAKAIENARFNNAVVLEIPAVLALARLHISQGNQTQAQEYLVSLLSRAPAGEEIPLLPEVQSLLDEIEMQLH